SPDVPELLHLSCYQSAARFVECELNWGYSLGVNTRVCSRENSQRSGITSVSPRIPGHSRGRCPPVFPRCSRDRSLRRPVRSCALTAGGSRSQRPSRDVAASWIRGHGTSDRDWLTGRDSLL